MLVWGEYNDDIVEDFIVFNLTSLREGLEELRLIPPFLKQYSDKQFDLIYANWLLTEPLAFNEMMQKIIVPLYQGQDVFIAISKSSEVFENLTESLQKFIEQRYGIISNNINEASDLKEAIDSEFSFQGVFNLDQDKEKYTLEYIKSHPEEIKKDKQMEQTF